MIVSTLRKEVICRIVERQMQGSGLIEEIVLQDMPQLHQSACEQFGTWDTALHYAGINRRCLYPRQTYTREQIIRKIRGHCRKALKLTAKCVRRHDYRLQEAACQQFGSWRKALRAAGVNIELAGLGTAKFRRLNRDQFLDALLAWAAAGHSLRWCRVCLENRALAVAARGRFGSWRQALLAAESAVATRPPRIKRKWDQQRIIDHIRRRQQEGKPMHYKAIRRDDGGLLNAARRHFGGWNQALTAAGIAPRPAPRQRVQQSL
jgi:hypothetical protein